MISICLSTYWASRKVGQMKDQDNIVMKKIIAGGHHLSRGCSWPNYRGIAAAIV